MTEPFRPLDRRSVSLGLAASLMAPGLARAQQPWPQGRQIRLVVPFTPAGATDVLGRIMADKLGSLWGASFVVENKPGAGGNIGTDIVAKAAPDGTTMLIVSVGMATNPYLYASLSYDPVKDFEPATLVAMVPNILVMGKGSKFTSVKEIIDYAKANPGKLTCANSGVGTSIHLCGELFAQMTGTKIVQVPYKGSGPALVDLMSGQVDIMFDNITSALPKVRGGQLKALAITTAKPSQYAPELQPVAATVPGFDVSSWFSLFLPARTPKEIVARVAADTRTALADPVVKEKLAALAAEPVGSSPEELARFLASESQKFGKLIKEVGIKAE